MGQQWEPYINIVPRHDKVILHSNSQVTAVGTEISRTLIVMPRRKKQGTLVHPMICSIIRSVFPPAQGHLKIKVIGKRKSVEREREHG